MKRILQFTAAGLALTSTFTAGVYAEDVLQKVEAYLRPDFNIVLDGKAVQLSQPTLVYQDKSYLPLAELTRLLGANINWQGDTRTIYINSRINEEQPEETGDPEYQAIVWDNPQALKLKYLGAEYPVLQTYDKNNYMAGLYYREKDIKRMGINTSGLKKAKERYSDEVYILQSELEQRWRQTPEQVYIPRTSTGTEYVVTDEIHAEKLKMLREQVKATLTMQYRNNYYYKKPVILDKLQGAEDEYAYYYFETVRLEEGTVINRYMREVLKLTKNPQTNDVTYTVNITQTTDLNSEADKRESP
ncbi:stalk domain-containing protein [Paenibacillus sp. S-38]|uniref:stalk domain-containing protein n=1 Tax=Paenibacillus sp. S-38 TaxID=3416710 RepID=UPI003CEAC7C8